MTTKGGSTCSTPTPTGAQLATFSAARIARCPVIASRPMAFAPDGDTLAVGMPLLVPDPVRLLDGRTLEPTGVRLPGLSDRRREGAGPAGRPRLERRREHRWPPSCSGSTSSGEVDDSPYWHSEVHRLLVWRMEDKPRLVLRRTVPGRTEQRRDQNQLALSADGSTVWTERAAHGVRHPDRSRRASDRTRHLRHGSRARREDARSRRGELRRRTRSQLVDARTGGVLARALRGHTQRCASVSSSQPTAGGSPRHPDRTAMPIVWDTRGRRASSGSTSGTTAVQGLAFSSDGGLLFTAGGDQAIRAWDLDGERPLPGPDTQAREFGFGWVLPSPGGHYTAHSDVDGRPALLRHHAPGSRPLGRACPARLLLRRGVQHRTGRLFAGSWGGRIWLFDPSTGEVVRRQHRVAGGRSSSSSSSWTPDDSRIILTDEAGDMGCVDAADPCRGGQVSPPRRSRRT